MNAVASRFPLLTCGLLAIAAGVSALPGARELAVGERSALVQGELWRLWTAQAVHFSGGHLLWSGAVWLAAAGWVERVARRALVGLVLVGSPLVTLAALGVDGAMARYGGLSGIACAPLGWLVCQLWRAEPRGSRRVWAAVLLALLLAKIGLEAGTGRAFVVEFDPRVGEVRSAVWAHVAGALVGLIAGAWRGREVAARPT